MVRVDNEGITVAIYCLRDPRNNDIRYVGKTKRLKKRYLSHLSSARKKPITYCHKWIKMLLRIGLKPIMEVLEFVPESEWKNKEMWWIQYGKDNGWNLTNHTAGGLSGIRDRITTEKISVANKGKAVSKETRMLISNAHKGKRQTLSQRMKTSAALKMRIHTLQSRLKVSGTKNVNAKLAEKEVNEIRQVYFNGGITIRELACIYNVCSSTIESIVRYNTWRQIETQLTIKQKINRIRLYKQNNKGENNPSAKLSYYKAEQIRKLYGMGCYPYDKLAEMYDVGKSTIARIIKGRVWAK